MINCLSIMYMSVTAACLAEPDRYGNHWPAIVHGATHVNKSLCANSWEGQYNFLLVVYNYIPFPFMILGHGIFFKCIYVFNF